MAFDTSPDADDDALLSRFASGDQSAARALTIRLTPGVLSLARRMLGNEAEAEDVAQEAMLRLWKIAPVWEKGRAKPSTWLYRVTQNLCTDRLRKKKPTSMDDVPEPVDDRPTAAQMLHETDRARALNEAVAKLPERQRMAVHLRYFQELPNGEVADAMEISVEATESLLGRAKRALAQRLLTNHDELGLM